MFPHPFFLAFSQIIGKFFLPIFYYLNIFIAILSPYSDKLFRLPIIPSPFLFHFFFPLHLLFTSLLELAPHHKTYTTRIIFCSHWGGPPKKKHAIRIWTWWNKTIPFKIQHYLKGNESSHSKGQDDGCKMKFLTFSNYKRTNMRKKKKKNSLS